MSAAPERGHPMHPSRRRARPLLTLILGGMVAAAAYSPVLARRTESPVPKNPDDRTIVHVLNRIGFGPMPGDVERVRTSGLEAYIERQLQPEKIDDAAMRARLEALTTIEASSRELAEQYVMPAQRARAEQQRARANAQSGTPPQPEMMAAPQSPEVRGERQVLLELSQHKLLRAAYSDRQLEEVMVDFWFNHFNVFAAKGLTRNYVTEYEREAIRPHVLGKFRDLLQATAESPAMLFYLDNWQSATPQEQTQMQGPARGRQRRGMRGTGTRTIADAPAAAQNRRPRGINENYARELMELHTLGVDGGYTQKDVQEVARAFTGWTIANPRQGGGFVFEPRMHDNGVKTVLGTRVSAGGKGDGERVLDLLAKHPSTARHIATKLARRFVSDDPPAALVDRAAKRFLETGGNIRDVVRTIVISPEFFAPETQRAKIKNPFEFVVSSMRATAAQIPSAMPLVQSLRELGMPLYLCQPPTGYSDKADAWVNTGALLNRMNFAVALTEGRIRGTRGSGALRAIPLQPADLLIKDIFAGDLSATTTATVRKAGTPAQTIALLLGSPEFQRK
jgi:uncharacterized protein (DUF1800 family)